MASDINDISKENEAGDQNEQTKQKDATALPETSESSEIRKDKDNKVNDNIEDDDLATLKADRAKLLEQIKTMDRKLKTISNELEQEIQRRCDLEQRFTDEAKRSTDQIEELIAKSDEDDARFNELKKRFDLYTRETSSMIENFTTNREVLTSQMLELRQENDYLLGKFIGKSRDLQNGEINLPQTVEELQFHCLTLNEKLILATLAKEQLEETLMQNTSNG